MKYFYKILKFELTNYLQNKVFMNTTLVMFFVIAILLSFPRIQDMFHFTIAEQNESASEMLVVKADDKLNKELFNELFVKMNSNNVEVEFTDDSTDDMKRKVKDGLYSAALICEDDTYSYVVANLSMTDSSQYVLSGVLTEMSKIQKMEEFGLSMDEIQSIRIQYVDVQVENLGLDQGNNFLYTYVMIMALYMAVVIYGQMVATNVASEKSSRAMELLITSAKPSNLLSGKVIASCLAGLAQLLAVFGTAILFYGLNKSYWQDNYLINSMFSMPFEIMMYMLVFFVFGYFLYASLFGAVGSLATKTEDINTLSLPVIVCFVAAYILVIGPVTSGNVDTAMMRFASYFPLTSPFAMFSRIALSTVPFYEVGISIAILTVTVIAIGYLSAKIYRLGVLMYGTKPKFKDVLKALIKA